LTASLTKQQPEAPLPPPTGTIITSTDGTSSNISRAYVPTPAIRSGSFAGWTNLAPLSPASCSAYSLDSSKILPEKIIFAPQLFTALTLVGLAFSGITIVTGTPKRCPA